MKKQNIREVIVKAIVIIKIVLVKKPKYWEVKAIVVIIIVIVVLPELSRPQGELHKLTSFLHASNKF